MNLLSAHEWSHSNWLEFSFSHLIFWVYQHDPYFDQSAKHLTRWQINLEIHCFMWFMADCFFLMYESNEYVIGVIELRSPSLWVYSTCYVSRTTSYKHTHTHARTLHTPATLRLQLFFLLTKHTIELIINCHEFRYCLPSKMIINSLIWKVQFENVFTYAQSIDQFLASPHIHLMQTTIISQNKCHCTHTHTDMYTFNVCRMIYCTLAIFTNNS